MVFHRICMLTFLYFLVHVNKDRKHDSKNNNNKIIKLNKAIDIRVWKAIG